MIIFTPEQLAAAHGVVNADAEVMDFLHHEPVNLDGPKWEHWNDGYQAAFQVHETADSLYRRLVGDIDPNDVIHGGIINPLGPSLVPDSGTVETADRRFVAGPFFHSRDTGPWAVDLYDPPLTAGLDARRVVTLTATGREHAQQIVDLVTWALGAGARTSEAVSA
ncbi:hypothetical protein [Nocardia nova]|uniref:hypothetical protein n=1 Tax=Nocardia nova TaxID=37330 RepID=UPI00189573A1|nr:hypothetical protein [Nocardia nova]MBF6277049.1 hypothetical protein [Nocardia nova]